MKTRSATRDNATAIDHLTAEVATFPFASEPSLARRVTLLNADMSGDTLAFWALAEAELLQKFPGVGGDELLLHRDHEWFGHGARSTTLGEMLKATARRHLVGRGLFASPSFVGHHADGEPLPPAAARKRWRWLARSIPPDLLLAALWGGGHCPREVALAQPQLERRLADDGFAELHLHLGAGLDFSTYWAATMASLVRATSTRDAFAAVGSPLGNGALLSAWLIQAAIVRLLLARFLVSQGRTHTGTFADHAMAELYPAIRRVFGLTSAAIAADAVRALARGVPDTRFSVAQYRAVLRALAGNGVARRRSTVYGGDPLARWFPPDPSFEAPPETAFLVSAFDYLEAGGDAQFALLFWQLQKVRCLYYRSVVLGPRTPGLTAFTRAYTRLGPGRQSLDEGELAALSAQTSGVHRGLRYLEVRTSPSDRAEGLAGMLSAMNGRLGTVRTLPNPRSQHELQWGLVLHFLRLRSSPADLHRAAAGGENWHANPRYSLNVSGYRFSYLFRQTARQVDAVSNLLQAHPSALRWLRGIDLCTDEMAVPVRVHAPFFRRLRRESEFAALRAQRHFGLLLHPLRCTVHVGEDFPHLLTGLRNIGHVLDDFPIEGGDRLGHALALGVDARRWASTIGQVRMPVETRLLDLAWAWECLTRRACEVSVSDYAALERETLRLSELVFGQPLRAGEVCLLQRGLHDPARLALAGFPDGPRRAVTPAAEVASLRDYLTSHRQFRAGRQLTWVDAELDIALCDALQRWLCRRVSQLGLAVEINPSSNLLVGNLGDLKHHPFWRLGNVAADPTTTAVPLVIGSDDPITFATTLPDEYSFLYDALVESGVSAAHALRLLDDIRGTGNDFRFTTDSPAAIGSGSAAGPLPKGRWWQS